MKTTLNDPKSVGQRIRNIRQILGYSMEQFAKKIDDKAKSGTVSNWETGKNLPNSKRLKTIAELGDVTIDYLLEGRYMLRDIHMMPEEEQKKLSIGKPAFSIIKEEIKPSILATLNKDEILTDGDWYLIYMAIKLSQTLHSESSIKNELAISMMALSEIYTSSIAKEDLESEIKYISEILSKLPYKVFESIK